MDLNRALTFARVVEDGGFTAAARTLRVPKSSVSRSVALLEQELGVLLLQRSTRKVELTEAGRLFYDRASRAFAGLEDAEAAVSDLQGSLRGTIRVTAPSDAGVWILAPLVARFVARHPAVHLDVLLTTRVMDLVGEGIDFAFRAAKLTDGSYIARRLATVELRLYAAPSYFARRSPPTTSEELATHECVLFRGDHGRTRWTLRGAKGEESVEVRGPVNVDNFEFVHQATVLGIGIGLMPAFLAAGSLERGELTRVLPEYCGPLATWHLVYPSSRYLPRRAIAFRDFIVEELGDASEKPR
jgi:DNA-binding transcriptional LysR family regulator